MKRVVLDTNVLAAGYWSRSGASFAILQAIAMREIRPLVTVALFIEYEDVLKRAEHLAAHKMTPVEVDRALAGFLTLAEPVEIFYRWRPRLSDAKDEFVLEAAVNAGAHALITHNVRDFGNAGAEFGLWIGTPGDFLNKVRT